MPQFLNFFATRYGEPSEIAIACENHFVPQVFFGRIHQIRGIEHRA